ncbi:GNAT family N-acetyltransferase [Nocardia sp. NPDC050710]|uniref:GNAT family N-acetyltransferase n=1 Tax=Nocardia sp. NPDC050710 TaxID=3157220 RepID=UPI0033E11443
MLEIISVRTAERSDLPRLSQTLAVAFQHDPVTSWMLPDDRRRAAGLPHFYATMARYQFLAGGGSAVAVNGAGVMGGAALWAPPGHSHTSQLAWVRMMPGLIRAFGRRLMAAKLVGDTLERHHPTEPHWYLSMIGTTPDSRGGGYGSALMHARLEVCDAENTPAYLESSSPDNVPYYEHFGFEVTGEIEIPGGPTLWPMWRRARSS